MAKGTTSLRRYHPLRSDKNHPVERLARLPNGNDHRRWDHLHFFASDGFVVSAANLPPSGVHLSDRLVGELLALRKGEGIHCATLAALWPNVFMSDGKIFKERRPMGEGFHLQSGGHVYIGQTEDGVLLCGAGSIADDAKVAAKAGYWKDENICWHVKRLEPKSVIGVSDYALSTPIRIDDDGGVWPELSHNDRKLVKKGTHIVKTENGPSEEANAT